MASVAHQFDPLLRLIRWERVINSGLPFYILMLENGSCIISGYEYKSTITNNRRFGLQKREGSRGKSVCVDSNGHKKVIKYVNLGI